MSTLPTTTNPSSSGRTFSIPPNHQISICVPFDGYLTIQCIAGLVEYNGREMPDKLPVDFGPGTRIGMYTYLGATVTVSNLVKFPVQNSSVIKEVPGSSVDMSEPVVKEPPKIAHVPVICANVNVVLETNRIDAAVDGSFGPIVLVCGDSDSGKSTVARTLANYAFKSGRQPIYVDINPENPGLSIPGTLALQPITHFMDSSMSMCGSHGAVQTTGLGSWPYIVWHGSDIPVCKYDEAMLEIYKSLCLHLSKVVLEKANVDSNVKHSGVIVDCPGGLSGELVEWLAITFQAKSVLYLTNTNQDIPVLKDIDILPIPACPNRVLKTRQFNKYVHLHAIREYFYGPMGGKATVGRVPLTPHNITVPVSVLQVYRLTGQSATEEEKTGSSPTPIAKEKDNVDEPTAIHTDVVEEDNQGKQDTDSTIETEGSEKGILQVVLMNSEPSKLVHSILAVVDLATGVSKECSVDEVMMSNVLGFVYVSDYKPFREKLEMLVPFPGRLPTTKLVAGSIKWMELS